ncbi:hypothetical protein TYRP_015652 [Tyrophagus putrescentiae]|nr:hypothetical protein TYRP_015652 [Tyrophagus putrescentiae]
MEELQLGTQASPRRYDLQLRHSSAPGPQQPSEPHSGRRVLCDLEVISFVHWTVSAKHRSRFSRMATEPERIVFSERSPSDCRLVLTT